MIISTTFSEGDLSFISFISAGLKKNMNRGVGDSDHFLRNKIPNIYKDNFVDLAKLCDSEKKNIH